MKFRYKMGIAALTVIFCFFFLEVGFRVWLNFSGKDVITLFPAKKVLEKAWFRPHPYLLYVFKPDHSFTMDIYGRHRVSTNSFGFRSTLAHDVKSVAKPPATLRIVTLGGSTTMGVNDDNEVWPCQMGAFLARKIPHKHIEIINEGIMGYTSLDNLLDISARVIDFAADGYVIYLGVNDLWAAAPLDIFKTDYSHFRKTLYESLYTSPAQLFPEVFFHSKVFRAVLQFSGVPDSRSLITNVNTRKFRKRFTVNRNNLPAVERKIRRTVIRNVKSMVGIIRAHQPGALILLSSFYDLQERRIIRDLNDDFQNLASRLNLVFVDAAQQLREKEKPVTYDYVHFTPEGDRFLGEIMAEAIIENQVCPQ